MPARRRRSAVLAVLAVLALPSGATAFRAEVRTVETTPGFASSFVLVTGTDAADDLVLEQVRDGDPTTGTPDVVRISTPRRNATVDPGTGCVRPTGTRATVECTVNDGIANPASITVDLGRSGDGLRVDEATRPLSTPLTVRGGDGTDQIRAGARGGRLEGQGDDDLLVSAGGLAFLAGGDGHDLLVGGDGIDFLEGGRGSDTMSGGGSPFDRVEYGFSLDVTAPARTTGVTATVDGRCNDGNDDDRLGSSPPAFVPDGIAALSELCTTPGASLDGIGTDVEAVVGTNFRDTLIGSTGADELSGLAGPDTLEGGRGADGLFGGPGDDDLVTRDGAADATTSCGEDFDPQGRDTDLDEVAADRELDRIEPDCERVGFGNPDATGPGGGGAPPRPRPTPPPAGGEPAPSPPPTGFTPTPPGGRVPNRDDDGDGPGGGDGGETPPDVRIVDRATVASRRRGLFRFRVLCVYRARACEGAVTFRLRRTLSGRLDGRRVRLRRGTRIARVRTEIPWGRSRALRLRLDRRVRRLLLRRGRGIDVRAEFRARDGAAGRDAAEARVRRTVRLGVARR